MQKIISLKMKTTSFLRFLVIGVTVAFSAVFVSAQSWRVKIDPDNNRKIVITVSTLSLQKNQYLDSTFCTVYFYNQNNEQIGEKIFNFTGSTPKTLNAKKTFTKKFSFSIPSVASIKGEYMRFKVFVNGGKSDGKDKFLRADKVKAKP